MNKIINELLPFLCIFATITFILFLIERRIEFKKNKKYKNQGFDVYYYNMRRHKIYAKIKSANHSEYEDCRNSEVMIENEYGVTMEIELKDLKFI